MYAYILISLKDGNEQEVIEEIQESPLVEEAHILFGEWDIIIKLRVQTPEEAGTFVMERVRKINTVRLTSTLIVAK